MLNLVCSQYRLTAINLRFLKKHRPILLQSEALSSIVVSMSRYLLRAPSTSFFDCFEQIGIYWNLYLKLRVLVPSYFEGETNQYSQFAYLHNGAQRNQCLWVAFVEFGGVKETLECAFRVVHFQVHDADLGQNVRIIGFEPVPIKTVKYSYYLYPAYTIIGRQFIYSYTLHIWFKVERHITIILKITQVRYLCESLPILKRTFFF